jgi:hypothetical protein
MPIRTVDETLTDFDGQTYSTVREGAISVTAVFRT